MTSKTILCVIALMLAGCKDDKPRIEKAPPINVKTYETGMNYRVREFTLTDGTRCVVVVDTGITCEWVTQRVEM